ncbi:carbohydrate ABC transporter permease [Nocardiopsis coralliicola]
MNVVSRTERYTGLALLLAMVAVVAVPFLSVLLASFHPPGTAVAGLSWPAEWTLENYRQAWTVAGFSVLLRNSLAVAAVVVPLSVVLATLAGYALGTMDLRGGNAVLLFFVGGLTIPVEFVVIPLYFDLRGIGLGGSLVGVMLAEIALFMPFSVYWMRNHFRSMPRELIEAARVDGASNRTVLTRIMLPLARPSLMTLSVLVFMWSWNQFLLVLILIQHPGSRTAPAGLGFFAGQHGLDIPALSAATVIVIFPIVLAYLFFQRSFAAGLLQGGLRG